jgi:thiamine-phosphate diphosphorylase/hydroxyethylthiazole kinase
LSIARRLLPPHTIIGVSVRNEEEARRAIAEGADYVGIGAVWDTSSKDLKGKTTLGPEGVGEVLDVLHNTAVKAVAIGKYSLILNTESLR